MRYLDKGCKLNQYLRSYATVYWTVSALLVCARRLPNAGYSTWQILGGMRGVNIEQDAHILSPASPHAAVGSFDVAQCCTTAQVSNEALSVARRLSSDPGLALVFPMSLCGRPRADTVYGLGGRAHD